MAGLMGIAERFFRKEEWDYLDTLPLDVKTKAFFQFWTLKEAYLKAMGAGWAGWDALPDLTPYVRVYSGLQGSVCRLGGEFMAFIDSSPGICMALVYRDLEHICRAE